MNPAPLISVVMPVHNGRRYVADAVRSILAQTFRDFELIVIDDGSTDGSDEIVRDLASADARIRLVRQENKGVTCSLNVGVAQARGTLIARMDADDLSWPERFEKQVRFLDSRPDHVLVGSRCRLIDPDGAPICEKKDVPLSHEQIDQQLLEMRWPIVHPAVMIRGSALKQIGGYDERYRTNQDHDLFLRLAEIGCLANLPDILLDYRQRFDSLVFKALASRNTVPLEIHRAALQRRGLPPRASSSAAPSRVLSPLDHRWNWIWWALAAGNVSTSRKHARALLRARPWSGQSWRAMYCAMRGW